MRRSVSAQGGNALPRPACRGPHPLRIDIDHQSDQKNQATDQDLEETVDVDVIEAVVQHAENEQADDCIADTTLAAKQAGAADDHGRDAVKQVGVELVLLGAAKIG